MINEYLKKNETEGEFKGKTFKVVENRGELNKIDVGATDYLLGKAYIGYTYWCKIKVDVSHCHPSQDSSVCSNLGSMQLVSWRRLTPWNRTLNRVWPTGL